MAKKLNPVFSGIHADEGISTAATVKGVAGKTILLLLIAVVSAVLSLTYLAPMVYGNPMTYFLIAIGAVVCGIIGQMSPNAAKVCSIIYSICEGVVLGMISMAFGYEVNGIVLTAVLLTGTIFGVMLLLYTSKIIRATDRFIRVMFVLGISISIISLIYIISYIINPNNMLIYSLSNNPGIVLLMSGFILLYAAFMLVLDFEQVNIIVSNGFDKKYEWMAALGLMVTLVWIYVEILRILYIIYQMVDRN